MKQAFPAIIVSLLAAAAAGCSDGPDPGDPAIEVVESMEGLELCEGGDSSAARTGEIVIRTRAADAPCRIVAIRGPVLTARDDSEYPSPGSQVVRSSDGTFYTTAAHQPSTLLHWGPDGVFLSAYEARGQGPGELSPNGSLVLFTGPADSLFVLDGENRWTVFAPGLELSRQFMTPLQRRGSGSIIVTSSGRILVANGARNSPSLAHFFHVYDGQGQLVSEFAPTEEHLGDISGAFSRPVAAVGESTFIAAPFEGSPTDVRLEQWTLDGQHLRTLRRAAAWIPAKGYTYPADDPSEPRLPEYEMINVDRSGLIWLTTVVRDHRWRHIAGDDPAKERLGQELWDARLEVFDPRAGRLLASFMFDGPEQPVPPVAGMFPGTRTAFRVVRDPLGLSSVEVYDLELVRKN